MTIVFNGDIPSGNYGNYTTFETGNASGFQLVDDPLGIKGTVLKTTLEYGDALAGGSHRTEISVYTEDSGSVVGATRWYKFSTLLPSTWQTGGNWATFFQVHDTPDGGDPARHPPVEWTIHEDGLLYIGVNHPVSSVNDNQVLVDVAAGISPRFGQWDDWVIQVVWQWQATGLFRVWRNRRKILELPNFATCYQDVGRNYPKFGMYVPLDLSTVISSRVAYHTGIVIGDNAYSTFNGFMAATGSSVTELEMVTSVKVGAHE